MILTVLALYFSLEAMAKPANQFVDVTTLDPSIHIEMLYPNEWNFTGHVVDGYHANICYLTRPAAKALVLVQKDLKAKGYGLWVTDCYRPKRAVADFVKWAEDANDLRMQSVFYPDEPKSELFNRGYIAEKSGHSRGSTLDLTVMKLGSNLHSESHDEEMKFQSQLKDCRKPDGIEKTGQLNMGTTVDCLNKLANTANPAVSDSAKINRAILKDAMTKRGFVNYDKEWWHFTLQNEPYPAKYFDFPVQ